MMTKNEYRPQFNPPSQAEVDRIAALSISECFSLWYDSETARYYYDFDAPETARWIFDIEQPEEAGFIEEITWIIMSEE